MVLQRKITRFCKTLIESMLDRVKSPSVKQLNTELLQHVTKTSFTRDEDSYAFLLDWPGRANVNFSPTKPWRRLSNWCSYNLSSNGRKCKLKNNGSAPKLKLKNNDSESKQKDNRRTWRLCFNSLRNPLCRARFYHLQQLRWQLH